jgi:cytidylate kinase
MDFKYDNISISGGVGVGTTTLMNNLKPYLEPYDWQFKSTGQFVREYTKENVVPAATLVSDDFDREIEARAKETLEKGKNWVIDAWLAGFVARDLKNTLRVLLICSNEAVRIDRVVNRDKVTVDDAKKNIRTREEENFKKWRRIYGDYNFFDPQYYHLVIDTYSIGQMGTVGKVLDELGYKNKHLSKTQV